mgnify:CR=1 FL=1
MEHTNKHLLRFYIALFSSVISHSVILLLLFIYAPSIELERKTIPFQLTSNDNAGQTSNQPNMSHSENALAAQEFLRTLNESTFEQLIRENTQKSTQRSKSNIPFKSNPQDESPFIQQPTFKQSANSSNALQGFQNIFSRKKIKERTQSETQQISTKSLEDLTEYEIQLLQRLARNELYDEYHPVMERNKQTQISYIITLQLFPNGSIKNAQINSSSSIKEIDRLAVQSAFSASPYPKPPKEDIIKNFKYNIPIIYKKNK